MTIIIIIMMMMVMMMMMVVMMMMMMMMMKLNLRARHICTLMTTPSIVTMLWSLEYNIWIFHLILVMKLRMSLVMMQRTLHLKQKNDTLQGRVYIAKIYCREKRKIYKKMSKWSIDLKKKPCRVSSPHTHQCPDTLCHLERACCNFSFRFWKYINILKY